MNRHLNITGSVQGVGFRYYFQCMARELGVTGWVRNSGDGSVEAVISGTPEALDRMVDWAREGPPAATVTRLEVSAPADADAYFHTFEILQPE